MFFLFPNEYVSDDKHDKARLNNIYCEDPVLDLLPMVNMFVFVIGRNPYLSVETMFNGTQQILNNHRCLSHLTSNYRE